jgi:hypothetical protein
MVRDREADEDKVDNVVDVDVFEDAEVDEEIDKDVDAVEIEFDVEILVETELEIKMLIETEDGEPDVDDVGRRQLQAEVMREGLASQLSNQVGVGTADVVYVEQNDFASE